MANHSLKSVQHPEAPALALSPGGRVVYSQPRLYSFLTPLMGAS